MVELMHCVLFTRWALKSSLEIRANGMHVNEFWKSQADPLLVCVREALRSPLPTCSLVSAKSKLLR
jgi:hypothetical protein